MIDKRNSTSLYLRRICYLASLVATLVFMGSTAALAAPPTASTLISPLNNVAFIGASQDFTWSEVPEATHYRLWVSDSSDNVVFKKWFKASSTELSCDGVECTTTVAMDFSASSFTNWQVRTNNGDGLGQWSGNGKFWSMQSRPVAATLVEPLDFTFGASPNFVWEPVPNATWYKLRLRVPGADPEIIYDQWLKASDSAVCFRSNDCSKVVNPVPGNPSAYEWSIRTYNPAGLGPWAEYVSVVLNDVPEPEVAGRYTVTSNGLTDFTTDCCSFASDGIYAIEVENAGGGTVDIESILFDNIRGQFARQSLSTGDECASTTSLAAGDKCKIGVVFMSDGQVNDDFTPPDGILLFWEGMRRNRPFYIQLEGELLQ